MSSSSGRVYLMYFLDLLHPIHSPNRIPSNKAQTKPTHTMPTLTQLLIVDGSSNLPFVLLMLPLLLPFPLFFFDPDLEVTEKKKLGVL
jgi:hypothetical protein